MAVDGEGDGGGGDPIDLAQGLTFSIARLAEEFGMARETVSKRLREAGVPSSGMRNGYAVYRLRDACPALFPTRSIDVVSDPKALPPVERNAWFQSENKRLDVEMRARELIQRDDHEGGLAIMARDIVNFLETLPDQLCESLSPEQTAEMRDRIARTRDRYKALQEPSIDKGNL